MEILGIGCDMRRPWLYLLPLVCSLTWLACLSIKHEQTAEKNWAWTQRIGFQQPTAHLDTSGISAAGFGALRLVNLIAQYGKSHQQTIQNIKRSTCLDTRTRWISHRPSCFSYWGLALQQTFWTSKITPSRCGQQLESMTSYLSHKHRLCGTILPNRRTNRKQKITLILPWNCSTWCANFDLDALLLAATIVCRIALLLLSAAEPWLAIFRLCQQKTACKISPKK